MSPTVYIMPDVHICRQLQFLYSPHCLASSFIINVEVCLTTLMIQPTFLSVSERSRHVWEKVASVKMKAIFVNSYTFSAASFDLRFYSFFWATKHEVVFDPYI